MKPVLMGPDELCVTLSWEIKDQILPVIKNQDCISWVWYKRRCKLLLFSTFTEIWSALKWLEWKHRSEEYMPSIQMVWRESMKHPTPYSWLLTLGRDIFKMNKTWALKMAWLVKIPATKVEDVSSSHRSDTIEMGNNFNKLFSEVQCANYGTVKPMF